MAIVRWDPLHEMMMVQRDMNQLFNPMASHDQGAHLPRTVGISPPIEIEEGENNIHLRLEMPGVDPKDLDVRIMKEAVCVSGERKASSAAEPSGHKSSKVRLAKFSRTFPLPTSVEETKVKANYKNGVLTLDLPKLEDGVRSVRVNSSPDSD